MDEREFITRLFAIPEHIVTSYSFTEDEDGIATLRVNLARQHKEFICNCGRKFLWYYDCDERVVRDLPYGKWKKVFLHFMEVRVDCPECGVKVERLPWLDPYSRVTKRLADEIAQACAIFRNVSDVAGAYHLDWHTVKNIDKRALKAKLDPPDFRGVSQIAVDELAIRRGHVYATRVLDLIEKRTLWVSKHRKKESLDEFYHLLGPDGCRRMQAVAMDMWEPYEKSTRQHCPQAEIVYDEFHILSEYSRVIDKVRNEEVSKQPPQNRQIFKGTKYLLLKNSENLRGDEGARLRELLRLNRPLSTLYVLKDDLKHLWRYTYPAAARRWFKQWYRRAIYSGIQPLKDFARKLKRHWKGIEAHCRYKINTAVIEGLNNVAKVIKRIAFGFRDEEYYFLKLRAYGLSQTPRGP